MKNWGSDLSNDVCKDQLGLGSRYIATKTRLSVVLYERAVQVRVVSCSARDIMPFSASKFEYSIYDVPPQQPAGLPRMADAVIVTFFRHFFPLEFDRKGRILSVCSPVDPGLPVCPRGMLSLRVLYQDQVVFLLRVTWR